jgi:hypothetical protein
LARFVKLQASFGESTPRPAIETDGQRRDLTSTS